jgi:hypothetical protein
MRNFALTWGVLIILLLPVYIGFMGDTNAISEEVLRSLETNPVLSIDDVKSLSTPLSVYVIL